MMTKTEHNNWLQANHDYLAACLAVLRCTLERYAARLHGVTENNADAESAQQQQHEVEKALPTPAALQTLCTIIGLSPFERDLLLLCAGVELDAKFAALCSTINGDHSKMNPNFSLALAALPDPHWSALTPEAPLRYWRLIEIGAGPILMLSSLRIDERILHYLTGVQHLDERLVGLIEPLQWVSELVPSHRKLAERIATTWSQSSPVSMLPVVQLCGDEVMSKRDIATAACAALRLSLALISTPAIPGNPAELESLIRLWEREVVLSGRALLVDCHNMDASDAARTFPLLHLMERIHGAVIILTRERLSAFQRPMITFEVHKPDTAEQRAIWKNTLDHAGIDLDGELEHLITQFSMNTPTIHAVCAEATSSIKLANSKNNSSLSSSPSPILPLWDLLWDACRLQSRLRLENLAQRIEPVATWDDLVLPQLQTQILREIALHVRNRRKVYEAWGFANKNSRGLGISSLFSGASGTGKTMAAEVLANELRLDLYRIDLSQVVSKYIGETEKNLRRVFDAAEEGAAILLFDEADALFGKRSEVKDSHDRYANIEISYLLQRMESYRGLAILTTNMKEALDQAFLRRIRFVVQFPFPDAAQRAEIWQRIFPANTPIDGLEFSKLARLNVTGGNIRNIALNASFLAADAEQTVRMTHLLRAARSEYIKLERSLSETEIGGWV